MFGSLALAIIWMSQPLLVGHDVALRWIQGEGATTCITDRELAAAVTTRLGGASEHGRARIVIEGDIATTGSGWTAAIRTADDHGVVLGQRELHEPTADCRAIDDKLVLVIALIALSQFVGTAIGGSLGAGLRCFKDSVSSDAAHLHLHESVAATAQQADVYVWAVAHARAPDYWFPRSCPRALAWVDDHTTDDDRNGIIGAGCGERVHTTSGRSGT